MSEGQIHENGSDDEGKISQRDSTTSDHEVEEKKKRLSNSSSISPYNNRKDSNSSTEVVTTNHQNNRGKREMSEQQNSTEDSSTTTTTSTSNSTANNTWNDTKHSNNTHPDNNLDNNRGNSEVILFQGQSETKEDSVDSIHSKEADSHSIAENDNANSKVQTTEEENSISGSGSGLSKHNESTLLSSANCQKMEPEDNKRIEAGSTSGHTAAATENATKTSGKTKATKTKRDKVNVTVPAPPLFESGVNTECIQLLRQLWNVHEEAVQFLENIRSALCNYRQLLRSEENDFELSVKEKKLSLTFSAAKRNSEASAPEENPTVTDTWVPLQPFIDGLKCICDNISEIEKQYVALSVFQSQCKLVLNVKIHHAKQQLTHDRLSILHGINQLIQVSLQLLSSPTIWTHAQEEKTAQLVYSIFQLTEVYNWCLEASWMQPLAAVNAANISACTTPSDIDSGAEASNAATPSKIRVLIQVNAANHNDSPLLRLSLKPLPATRLLQIVGLKRATFVSLGFARTTQQSFYAANTASSSTSARVLPMDKYQSLFNEEESRLDPFAKGFSQCPSLLGRAAVKKSESGEQRLTRSARTKMYNYFHEVLWTLVGELAEDLLLWALHNAVPLVFHSLDTFIALRNSLTLGKHIQDSKMVSSMMGTFDSVAGALHSISLLVSWDEKMRSGFEAANKVKRPEQVSLLVKPEPSQWATDVGSKFGEIVSTCISLIDGGHNAASTSERMRLASFTEEEPLGDEAQTLFRLEATLVYFKSWIVKRSKVWLNGWAIPQFLACSQREPALLVQLIKSRESILITREILLISDNVSVRLSANHRQMCADDLRAALQQLQSMPEELLVAVGPVCKTLSLATLQSYMPSSSHWRGMGPGSGLDPDKPSSYVKVFIDRVIEPVTTAAVELVPGPVQESVGKQVVHASCDAWLQYILQKRIRFSEWGAVQLLRDFISLRDWIRHETLLEKEARKSILQLEVLKRCEGVAYLLLRSPGDILGVGKPTRRSRRVAPSSDSVEMSPSVSENSAGEDDIPPEMYVPNQQMWLELRLRRGVLSPCCS